MPSLQPTDNSPSQKLQNALYQAPSIQQASIAISNHPFDDSTTRIKVVVVGLGMVGLNFVERLLKADEKVGRYEICIFGEEPHVAYNRVGLTSFFEHREVCKLYLQPLEWYKSHPEQSFAYKVNTRIDDIRHKEKKIVDQEGNEHSYDICVLSTGSEAVIPRQTKGWDANGVYVYRNITDLEKMIHYGNTISSPQSCAVVIGGGLLGLEAAAALKNMDRFSRVVILERDSWILGRQVDEVASGMVKQKVIALGVDVETLAFVAEIETDPETNTVIGIRYENGDRFDCQLVCFAIGVRARDELAKKAGLRVHQRGGIIVNSELETSVKDIYAIGECASFENFTYGLIAPGIEMASVLVFNLTEAVLHQVQKFRTPDLSTKLKLLGVHVASFGDYFADRDGPASIPRTKSKEKLSTDTVKALVYNDPFTATYKKYIFSADGKYLLGGMMIGDTSDYIKLLSLVKSGKPLEVSPSELIVGKQGSETEDLNQISGDTQICSCNSVSKDDICKVIKDGTCTSVAEVKSCTKAGTTCGGCIPLVQSLYDTTMKEMGKKKLQSFATVMQHSGKIPSSIGCTICKPAIASILSSLWNKHVMNKPLLGLQDTNDKYLGNIQRNGTYSVVPRVPAGEITPAKLMVLGQVAEKYKLYTKITGGQRIDLFGAKKQDLPDIWEELVNAGFESGHAYGKSLRTVKSCVGSSWCRYGVGDSVGLALSLEERYKSIRSPHKLKGGVSGCVRECAEAQGKDFGLIATEKGYNIYVCGNGGSVPKHAQLLIANAKPSEVVPILDRFLMFYIRTADRLQRTARWLEKLPGGMEYLKKVILEDSLGINESLEKQMQELVGTAFCEWTEVVNSPEKRLLFKQFGNTDETVDTIELVQERNQLRPANWPLSDPEVDFRSIKWQSKTWVKIMDAASLQSARTGSSCAIKYGDTMLALYHIPRKGYFCSQAMCPHKRAFVLHDGLLCDDQDGNVTIACPLHKREFNISVDPTVGGTCSDPSMSIATFMAEERDGEIWVELPPIEEIDMVLGTSKWKVREGEAPNQLEGLDIVGRKPFFESEVKPVAITCGDQRLDW